MNGSNNDDTSTAIDPLAEQVLAQVRAAAKRLEVTDKPYQAPTADSPDSGEENAR